MEDQMMCNFRPPPLPQFPSRLPMRQRMASYTAEGCLQNIRANRHAESTDSSLVRELSCRKCSALLCRRGMRVLLVADPNVHLFSADIVDETAVELYGEAYPAPKCRCQVRTTRCGSCTEVVGYRVVKACSGCLSEDSDNGQYWLFNVRSCSSALRKGPNGENMLWSELPLNESGEAPLVFKEPPPQHLTCCICQDPFNEAVCCRCGHSYCKGCIIHELDVRGRCPLDRQELTRDDLFANLVVQQEIGELLIRCRYGLKKRAGHMPGATGEDLWEVDPDGCQECIPMGDRESHELVCPHRSGHGRCEAAEGGEGVVLSQLSATSNDPTTVPLHSGARGVFPPCSLFPSRSSSISSSNTDSSAPNFPAVRLSRTFHSDFEDSASSKQASRSSSLDSDWPKSQELCPGAVSGVGEADLQGAAGENLRLTLPSTLCHPLNATPEPDHQALSTPTRGITEALNNIHLCSPASPVGSPEWPSPVVQNLAVVTGRPTVSYASQGRAEDLSMSPHPPNAHTTPPSTPPRGPRLTPQKTPRPEEIEEPEYSTPVKRRRLEFEAS